MGRICSSGKRTYLFLADAEKAVTTLIAKRGADRKWPYQCRDCKLWHLTSHEPW